MVGADLKNLVNEAALTARAGATTTRSSWPTSPTRWRRSCSAPSAGSCSPPRSASAPPTTSPATPCSACSARAPTRCARSRSSRAGRALGVTFQSPDADRYGYDGDYLRGRIVGALGGRAAEEIVYGDVTTGAESDLEQVTRIARQMVGPLGHVGRRSARSPCCRGPATSRRCSRARPGRSSPATRELVDARGPPHRRRLLRRGRRRRCSENRDQLEALAQALLERETLDEADAYRVAGFDRPPQAENPVRIAREAAENGKRDEAPAPVPTPSTAAADPSPGASADPPPDAGSPPG